MAGLRKFPKATSSYVYADGDDASHKGKDAGKARPRSAPSNTQAGRKLLTARQPSKPYYKVTYPLRNRKKYGIGNDCNAAPNAEYTVTGRGYTFTRHDNKFTMNINSDVFFDDKPKPTTQAAAAPTGTSKREASLSPTQNSQKQSVKASNIALQKKLEESIQLQERLHQSLVQATVKLEEQKYEQEVQETKMIKQHEDKVERLLAFHEKEKKELVAAHEDEIIQLETQHASKLADHQAAAINREALLKEEISQKEDMIIQIEQSHETDLINSVTAKEEELNEQHKKAVEDLTAEIINDFKQQQSSQIRSIEKKYERIISEKTAKHQKEINELLARFENSAAVEEDLKKATQMLQDAEMEIEHQKAEKEDLIKQFTKYRVELQVVTGELNHYKRKFQEKVDEVVDQHGDTINQLRSEVTDLRKLLMKKSQELTEMKIEEETRSRKSLFNVHKLVLQARIKANLPLASPSPELMGGTRERRGSAPLTKDERKSYQQYLVSSEYGSPLSKTKKDVRTASSLSGHSKYTHST
ncbi:meiosis-specific nuclear structural protein 1-like [Dysidea avara]|uniref:meiosis-specific nuclear structural protein 1-like n=1 Tax=Dysidea avara TaxID=196820 RepID=UPI003332D118